MLKQTGYIALVLFFMSIWGCRNNTSQKVETPVAENSFNQLVIYCENSMVPYVLSLQSGFEKKHKCKLKIINDCSQNLIGVINFSKQGDLFLPDTRSAFSIFPKRSNVYITDSLLIGYNKLTLIIPKGNPLDLKEDITSILSKPGLSIVFANPETSSLGFTTRQFLTTKGIYLNVLQNVVALSVDSRGLIKSVVNHQADITISWESEYYRLKTTEEVESIPIDTNDLSDIYIGVLSCSKNPKLANYFLNFVSSDESTASLKQFGIIKRKTPIF